MTAEMDLSQTASLLEEADPVIRSAIRKKLRVTLRAGDTREQNLDGLDLLGEVQLKLLSFLRENEDAKTGIVSFKAYAATVAYHCCADYLRARYPQRASLKNCLRRLLDTRDGYAVWPAENGEAMCGYSGWKGRPPEATGKIRQLQQDPAALPSEALPRTSGSSITGNDWLRLLEAVFDYTGAPLPLADLLTIVAPLAGVEDVAQYDNASGNEEEGALSPLDNAAAQTPDAYSVRLTVERLRLYWGAILQLLPWHRAAYLLNLRDGDLDALPYYGVVSVEGIGSALELKEKQLSTLEQQVGLDPATRTPVAERFAACWKFLPLEDAVIALVLEVTRPQVIGYRTKARERLARSLKGML